MDVNIRMTFLWCCMVAVLGGSSLRSQVPDFPVQSFWRLAFVSENGGFRELAGASVDPQGNVYVVDRGAHMIHRIGRSGMVEISTGGYGWGNQEFDRPSGIWAKNGVDVYISDYGNHRIQRYDRRLTYVASLETRVTGFEIERFGYPLGVLVNRQGDLFVLDEENLRIVSFSSFDRHLRTFGGFDAGRFRIGTPRTLMVFGEDNIVVRDGKRLLFFDPFGTPYREFPSRYLPEYKDVAIEGAEIFFLQDESIDIYRGDFNRPFERISLLEYLADPGELLRIAVGSNRIVLMSDERVWIYQLLR